MFKDGTLFFSRAETPNLARVIPSMDHMDEKLTTASRNDKLHKAIRVSCQLAKRTLNMYYSLTDMSAAYRIAMGK